MLLKFGKKSSITEGFLKFLRKFFKILSKSNRNFLEIRFPANHNPLSGGRPRVRSPSRRMSGRKQRRRPPRQFDQHATDAPAPSHNKKTARPHKSQSSPTKDDARQRSCGRQEGLWPCCCILVVGQHGQRQRLWKSTATTKNPGRLNATNRGTFECPQQCATSSTHKGDRGKWQHG